MIVAGGIDKQFLSVIFTVAKILGIIAVLMISGSVARTLISMGPKGRKSLSDAYGNAARKRPIVWAIVVGNIIVIAGLFLWMLINPKGFESLVDPSILGHSNANYQYHLGD